MVESVTLFTNALGAVMSAYCGNSLRSTSRYSPSSSDASSILEMKVCIRG